MSGDPSGDPSGGDSIGGPVHDSTHTALPMIAVFEVDLIRPRVREGMKVAKAKGRLRSTFPMLRAEQDAHLDGLHAAEDRTMPELVELISVGRSIVHRAIERAARKAISADGS